MSAIQQSNTQNEHKLHFVTKPSEYIENQTDELWLAAIHNGCALKYVENRTDETCLSALSAPTQSTTNIAPTQSTTNIAPIILGFLKYSFSGTSDEDVIKVVNAALESTTGFVYFDTAAAYGNNRDNEHIAGRIYNKVNNNRIRIITKFGIAFNEANPFHLTDLEIYESYDKSIASLGRVPDVFMSHRIPKDTPVTELTRIAITLGRLNKYCNVSIGMSEPSIEQLTIMLNYVPVEFIEISYGPFDVHSGELVEFAKSKNITILAYGVCLRGVLNVPHKLSEYIPMDSTASEHKNAKDAIDELKANGISDFTLNVGFFQPENILHNWNVIKMYLHYCGTNEPNNVAVQWCYTNGVVPIIETTSAQHLKNNMTDINVSEIAGMNFALTGSPNSLMLAYLDR